MAFVLSSVFASVVTIDNTNSTKLTAIQDDSFEPSYINEVPTVKPKIENTTNITDNITDNDTYEDWNDTYTDWNETIEEILEY